MRLPARRRRRASRRRSGPRSPPCRRRPVQRLDPDGVAGGDEAPVLRGHDEREHAVQARERRPGRRRRAGAARPRCRRRSRTRRASSRRARLVVVDLAVADEERAAVRGAQRLVAAVDVDDRQPPVPEPVRRRPRRARRRPGRGGRGARASAPARRRPRGRARRRSRTWRAALPVERGRCTRRRGGARRPPGGGRRGGRSPAAQRRRRPRAASTRAQREAGAARRCARARCRPGRRPSRRRGSAADPSGRPGSTTTQTTWFSTARACVDDVEVARLAVVARARAGSWRSTGQAASSTTIVGAVERERARRLGEELVVADEHPDPADRRVEGGEAGRRACRRSARPAGGGPCAGGRGRRRR